MGKKVLEVFKQLEIALKDVDINEVFQLVKREEILLTNTEVSARVFNYWKNNHLIDLPNYDKDSNSWIKLSFVDYIWLCCLVELRKFGIPIKQLIEIKKILFEKIIINTPKYSRWAINFILKKSIDNDPDLKKLKSPDAPGKIMEKIKDFIKEIRFIDALIYYTFILKKESAIIIRSDGTIFPWMDKIYEINPDIKPYSKPHIKLPFNYFYQNIIENDKVMDFAKDLNIISEVESQLLEIMRSGDCEEVKISLENGEYKSFAFKKSLDKVKILDTVNSEKFQDILLKRRDGKIVRFEQIIQMKYDEMLK